MNISIQDIRVCLDVRIGIETVDFNFNSNSFRVWIGLEYCFVYLPNN